MGRRSFEGNASYRLKALRTECFGFAKILCEFNQFFFIQVRSGPKSHSRLRPVNHIVTLKGRRRCRLWVVFLCRPYEEVDDVIVPLEDERGHTAPAKII